MLNNRQSSNYGEECSWGGDREDDEIVRVGWGGDREDDVGEECVLGGDREDDDGEGE